MTNIPTDLLRTLVTIVDMRSFTKAAMALGVTQPAVSAQIKRLQFLLGADLFDRSTQGISLSPQGEIVVSYSRRLLSINDQIVHLGGNKPRSDLVIRVGTPSDYIASILPNTLAQFRQTWPEARFAVRMDFNDPLLRELRSGELDIFIGLSPTPPHDARHTWVQEAVWVRGPDTRLDPDLPVPLVSYGQACVYHRLAVAALRSAGLGWEDIFTGPSIASLDVAVNAGFGVMALTRGRASKLGMIIWEDAPLPKLPEIYTGIYIREGGARAAYEQLADQIAAVIRAPTTATPKLVTALGSPRKVNTAA